VFSTVHLTVDMLYWI